jgi:hypothetical protein
VTWLLGISCLHPDTRPRSVTSVCRELWAMNANTTKPLREAVGLSNGMALLLVVFWNCGGTGHVQCLFTYVHMHARLSHVAVSLHHSINNWRIRREG